MMKIRTYIQLAGFALSIFLSSLGACASAVAAESGEAESVDIVNEARIELAPVSHAFVSGDRGAFQAHNWRPANYQGGIEEFVAEGGDKEDLWYEVEGHSLINANDHNWVIRIEKKGVGYFEFDYHEFRKYYDNNGGVYSFFAEQPSPELDRELSMDIGHFGIEVGFTPEDLPHLIFRYEREYKDGSKSRTTWGEREEGGITKNITPSWQEVNERVDVFEFREEHTVNEVKLEGKQRWEIIDTKLRRYEIDTSPSAAAGDNKITIQDQEPSATVFTNTIKAQRWFSGDRVFTSGGYHYVHLNSREDENIREFDLQLTPRSFGGFAHNRFNNHAENDLDQHALNFNVMVKPHKTVSVITSAKGEFMHREGSSQYNSELTDPPDGTINRIQKSFTENHARKLAEGVKVRYNGIPKTALYTEVQLQQGRDYVSEDSTSLAGQSGASAGDIFERETIDDQRKGVFVIGGNFQPVRQVTMTNQFRYKRSNHDFDHQRETNPGATAFYDEINISSAEFNSRIAVRPCSWFNTAFRYMVRDSDYRTRYDSQPTVQSGNTSDSFTFDATLIPAPNVIITGSFTRATSSLVNSRVRDDATTPIPTFNSDVNTWMMNIDFFPTEKVNVNSNVYYSIADNLDTAFDRIPYGAAFSRVGIETNVEVAVANNVSVEAGYEYQNYAPQPGYSSADYHAHILGFKVNIALG